MVEFTVFEFQFFFAIFFIVSLFFAINYIKFKNYFFLFLAGMFLLFCWGVIYNGVPIQTGVTIQDVNSSYHVITNNISYDGGPATGSIFVYILQILLAVSSSIIIIFSTIMLLKDIGKRILG